MQYYVRGSETDVLGLDELREGLYTALNKLGIKKKVLAIPPDFTRFHSHAGVLTRMAYDYYNKILLIFSLPLGPIFR